MRTAVVAPDAEREVSARLKFQILASGLRIGDGASSRLFDGAPDGKRAKQPLVTRSGVSGGLDLQLGGEVFVNAPVLEPFTQESPLLLDDQDGRLVLLEDERVVCDVSPLGEPAYYALRTSDGEKEMRHVGQMCSPDRFCYGMTGPGCSFWRPDRRCRYCSIGSHVNVDGLRKREKHLYEALEAACLEKRWPARHVLLGGGTPSGDDMGASLAARLCRGIKERFDLPVYVMIVAPLDNDHIDRLADAGVDELGLNIEFWSDAAWEEYIPGKHVRVGRTRYLEALEHAVGVFGSFNTRSIIIAGLEPLRETVAGVTALAEMGVMPIISPFRPLVGTLLSERRGFDVDTYLDLYRECQEVALGAGACLGPTCVCCQNNTLALPFGEHYRRY
jgi:hypothetical protein